MPVKPNKKNMPRNTNPVARPYPPPQYLTLHYCSKCGTEMYNDYIHHSYNKNNGKEMFIVESICPNRKNMWDGHDKYMRYSEWGGDRISALFYKDGTRAS